MDSDNNKNNTLKLLNYYNCGKKTLFFSQRNFSWFSFPQLLITGNYPELGFPEILLINFLFKQNKLDYSKLYQLGKYFILGFGVRQWGLTEP